MANYIKTTAIQDNSISESKLDSSLQSWKGTITNHINNTSNPHNTTKSDVGLGNVTNDAQVKRSELGSANGVATLDATGKIPSGQLPSYVDDVIEGYLYNGVFYKDTSYTTSIVGESGKIYIDLPTNKTYRWTGSVYGVISETIALGELSSTAYRGDRGKIAYDHSQSAHAPSNAQANVIETIKVNGTVLTPNSKAVDITIPTVGNGTITIKQGGTSKGTFTTNQNGNTTIELIDTNTTYTAGDGLSLSGTTFNNSGVRSVTTGTTNGTINVNTNGTTSSIAVYGLGSAAYTNSTAYATSSHTHSYLPLSGGTMSNTNVVTNLNADLLDGYHHSSFAKVASSNDLIVFGNEFNFVPSGYAGEVSINFRTTGGKNGAISKYIFCNGAGAALATISAGQFDGNAVSSSKWSTARTITLTGSVTGSVSIDGSGDVSLATTTNHTHNYAGSSSAGGSANSALTLLYNNKFDTTYGGYAIFQQGADMSDFPHTGWFNSIKMLHNNSHGYFTEIAMSFTGGDGMWRRALINGTQEGWYRMLDSSNYNSYAPSLTGSGASGTWGINISGNAATAAKATQDGNGKVIADTYLPLSGGMITGTDTTPLNIKTSATGEVGMRFLMGGSAKAWLGYTPNVGTYLYAYSNHKLGLTDAGVGFLDSNTIIHSGNYNSYAPKLDGTGATGTWGISISGNAATATKLQNSRTIWGQSFNGTGNVSGNMTGVGSITPTTDNSYDIGTSSNQFRWVYAQGLFAKAGSVLRLGANNTDHMRINTNGNVGIGIENPQYKLHVAGSILSDLGNSGGVLIGRYGNTIDGYTNGALTDLHLNYTSSGNLTMCKGGGNVGIGTVSPAYKLHVAGDGYFTENVITESDFSSRGNAIIDGRVGIGTSSPAYNLDVDGNMRITGPIRLNVPNSNEKYYISTEYNGLLGITYEGRYQNPAFLMNNLGYVYLNCENPLSPAYPLVVNGTIECTKLLQTSDIKYKTNIKQIEYEEALKIIENLNPVTWDWNENTVETGSSSGFVAQEAEEFIPNAISRDNENNLSLDYTQLHSYEIKVIQEQQKEIKDLKQRLEVLENLVLQLTNREI